MFGADGAAEIFGNVETGVGCVGVPRAPEAERDFIVAGRQIEIMTKDEKALAILRLAPPGETAASLVVDDARAGLMMKFRGADGVPEAESQRRVGGGGRPAAENG